MTNHMSEKPIEQKTFWSVARKPKWILALLAALALAAVFSLLGQWQLERSFRTVGLSQEEQQRYLQLEQVLSPGKAVTQDQDGKPVVFEATPKTDRGYIVANRQQGGVSGYWIILDYVTEKGVTLVVANSWWPTEQQARDVLKVMRESKTPAVLQEFRGTLLATEAPEPMNPAKPDLLQSLSTAQLINLYSPDKPIEIYSGAVALEGVGGSAIKIVPQSEFVELNFLNIFYAIEWVLFAGFAVFMWWRLVEDERLGLRDPDREPDLGKRPDKSNG